MRKCEKCQIKVPDDANFCPICGGKLTESGENGEFISVGETVQTEHSEPIGFESILNMSFDEKLKGVFMQKNMQLALAFMLLYIAYLVIGCIKMPIMILSGIIPLAVTVCLIYPSLQIKKDKFKESAHTSFTVLYAVAIAYMCICLLGLAAMAICGVVLILGGRLPYQFAFIYSAAGDIGFDLGITLLISTVISLAVTLPYFISLIRLTKSLKNGLDGKVQNEIAGASVFKVYTYITSVLSIFIFATLIVTGDFTAIFALLWTAAQIMIANALCDFDKILKLHQQI